MLIDSLKLTDTTIPAPDVCIIGAGAAGMVLALELAKNGLAVALLETGGKTAMDFSGVPRSGGSSGFAIDGQRLQLGGSLSDWGANCALLDQSDFDETTESDLLNWPFPEAELSKRTSRAAGYLGGATICGALEQTRQPKTDRWQATSDPLPVKPFLKGDEKLAQKLAVQLSRDDHPAHVVTHASVLGFDLDDSGSRATHVRFARPDGTTEKLSAKTFVLAAGIENVPILLRGLGNEPDKSMKRWPELGRRVHSHLLSLHGVFHPAKGITVPQRYCLTGDLGQQGYGRTEFLGLRLGGQGSLHSVTWLSPLDNASPLVPRSFARKARRSGSIWSRLTPRHARQTAFGIRHFLEQPARPGARVRLGKATGPYHLPEPIWEWRVGDEEVEAMQAVCANLDTYVQTAGLGRVTGYAARPRTDATHIKLNAHPMGGSIAGHSARDSVVSKNLNVHGIGNLYVCGGSVIPRGGTAMVTTVIIQLALRLADHLVQRTVQ